MIRDIKELRGLSVQELQSELLVLRKASLDLRLSASVNQLRDVSMFKKTRAQIARVLAFLREREKSN
jgi:large subunit ribosomal protein L29